MGFLKSVKSLFSGSGRSGDESAYYVYVRCRRCGEPIKSRIDLYNDLSLRDEGGYWVHKTLMGRRHCFERIDVTLYFDDRRQVIDRQISRGTFISAEEYEADVTSG
ncbi:MAG: hypothetical protein D6784_11940 [Chloroflexi bacterium]|nr:MAG: hypothetical protein D6784_11940 [Chloroflexota bacterium]